ncbi:hypothetical protein [Azospirillum sp.]|uniref:hypothetical protein n=1 Tax=Azospirillum sp. TaxID=34012 RepID=UPI0026098AE1|nr:hypothetical protein [Azospirillum sp.]
METIGILALTFAVLTVYAIVRERIAAYTQPSRLEMARIGEELIGSERLPEDDKGFVRFLLDNATKPWPMVVATFALPALAIIYLFGWKVSEAFKEVRDEALTKKTEKFMKLVTGSLIAANPAFAFLILCWIIIIALAIVISGGTLTIIKKLWTNALVSDQAITGCLRWS